MKTYLVGGAVRDELLGLPVIERDWVVVGATPEDMVSAGFKPVSGGFPVFLHPQTGEEYALARREAKTGHGYRGFVVESGPDVSLEEDLRRRDLTINAIAREEQGALVDPFSGVEDIERRRLRHVSPAFAEDPVRLLRIARFAAYLGELGFRVDSETAELLVRMSSSGELRHLRAERTTREMMRAMATAEPWQFFELLHQCTALTWLFPQLAAGMQDSTRPMQALRRICADSGDPSLRWAVMVASLGLMPEQVAEIIRQQKIGKGTANLLLSLVNALDLYPRLIHLDAEELLIVCERFVLNHKPEDSPVIRGCEVLFPAQAAAKRAILQVACNAVARVQARELLDRGYQGAELGAELVRRRQIAIEVALQETRR